MNYSNKNLSIYQDVKTIAKKRAALKEEQPFFSDFIAGAVNA
jgi:hypothetical protein